MKALEPNPASWYSTFVRPQPFCQTTNNSKVIHPSHASDSGWAPIPRARAASLPSRCMHEHRSASADARLPRSPRHSLVAPIAILCNCRSRETGVRGAAPHVTAGRVGGGVRVARGRRPSSQRGHHDTHDDACCESLWCMHRPVVVDVCMLYLFIFLLKY